MNNKGAALSRVRASRTRTARFTPITLTAVIAPTTATIVAARTTPSASGAHRVDR